MRGYIETVNLFRNKALTVNGKTTISDEFPVGEGWFQLNLRFNIVVTIGTGSGAINEGELALLKNIFFKTDRGENICNLPGRALYKIGAIKAGSPPTKDAIAAASATYTVTVPIYFTDKSMMREEDTILDTSRYSALQLETQIGTVADLFSTVGTSSITVSLDCDVVRVKGLLPKEAKPVATIYYDVRPSVDTSTATLLMVERAADLFYKRFYLHTATSAVAGSPFSGINANTVIDRLDLRDQSGFIVKDRIFDMIQKFNKDEYSLESVLTGIAVLDFVKDKSIQSALASAGKPLLQFTWVNGSGGGVANANVSLACEGIRALKEFVTPR